MKKIIIIYIVLLTACATAPTRDDLSSGLGGLPIQYTDAQTVEEVRALRPQAKPPLKVAVMPSRSWGGQLTIAERRIIKGWEKELQEIGFLSTLQIMPNSLVPSCGYKSEPDCFLNAARVSAARLDADAILFLNSSTKTDHYVNPLSVLNMTIIGMWFAPGHHRDSYSIYEGALFDVDNGYLYAIAEGEGQHKSVRPYVYTDWALGQEEAKTEALNNLGVELIKIAKSKIELLNGLSK